MSTRDSVVLNRHPICRIRSSMFNSYLHLAVFPFLPIALDALQCKCTEGDSHIFEIELDERLRFVVLLRDNTKLSCPSMGHILFVFPPPLLNDIRLQVILQRPGIAGWSLKI